MLVFFVLFFSVEVSSVHRSDIILSVVVVVVVLSLVGVLAFFFSFLLWYKRYKRRSHKFEDPPTYTELCKMSTIYDPGEIPPNTDVCRQDPQEEYGITYMDLLMMKTDKDN